MPKMKTHSGAKKRFRLTGTGKVKKYSCQLNHILAKKSPKVKRQLGMPGLVADVDVPRIKRLLAC